MKINEIIKEARYARSSMRPTGAPEDPYADPSSELDVALSSNADSKMSDAVRKVCDQYKGQGHAQVELLPFLTKVMEIVKKPVNLADLIAINKASSEIRSIIDTIDEKKVKFKNMSVKNEDPAKDQKVTEKKQENTVAGMASRAAKIK